MARRKLRITQKDIILANRKASREKEIAKHGRQILFRTSTSRSRKAYDRKRMKKAGIEPDDLPESVSAQRQPATNDETDS